MTVDQSNEALRRLEADLHQAITGMDTLARDRDEWRARAVAERDAALAATRRATRLRDGCRGVIEWIETHARHSGLTCTCWFNSQLAARTALAEAGEREEVGS